MRRMLNITSTVFSVAFLLYMEKTIKFSILAIIMALMIGCGGGGGGGGGAQGTNPAITSLMYSPTSAFLNAGGGFIVVSGTINFSDPNGDVSTLTISTFTSGGQSLSSATTAVQGAAGKTSGVIGVSVAVPTTAVGSYTFQVFVTDAAGHASNTLSGTFSVVAGGGALSLVTSTGPYPAHLVVGIGTLFWSESGENPVKSISLAGGSPKVLAQKIGVPAGFVVQGQDVFWLDERSGIASSGCAGQGVIRILKRTSTGTTTTVLATGDNCAPINGTSDVVSDGTYVYWVTSTATPDTYVIQKTPISGGASTAVTTTSVPIVAMTGVGGNLYWMENFFPDITRGAIREAPAGGGPLVTLASGFSSRAGTFAINSTSAFYTQANFPSTDSLVRVPISGGSGTVLATLASTPKKLVADDANVFWIDSTTVSSMPVAGGTPTVLANAANIPDDLALRTSDVVWSETTGPSHGETGAVKSVPKAGGAVSVLVQGGDAPQRLGGDASSVYWAEGGAIGLTEGFGRIARVPAGGGTATTVVSGVTTDSAPICVSGSDVFIADKLRIKKVSLSGGMPETLAVASDHVANLVTDGVYVYWDQDPFSNVYKAPVNGGTVTGLATAGVLAGLAGPIRLQNGTVYWMTNFNAILAVPTAGGTVKVVASNLPYLSDFVVDETNVYFSEQDTGNIMKMPVAGGTATLLASGYVGSYNILALDSVHVYWINRVSIGKVPIAGGAPTFSVSGAQDATFPASIALDATNVYWTQPPIAEIWKAPK